MKKLAIALIVLGARLAMSPAAMLAAPQSHPPGIQINEVMFRPAVAAGEWVELKNTSGSAVNLRGYLLGDEDGNVYRVPASLPDVPAGAYVLVRFDGLGAANDDTNFADNLAVLHSAAGQVGVFEDAGDQVGLYLPAAGFVRRSFLPMMLHNFAPFNPPVPNPTPMLPDAPVIDFVAWGSAPGDDGAAAESSGTWSRDWYVSVYRGLGFSSDDALVGPGETIGRARGDIRHTPDAWTMFRSGEATPGAENALPGVAWMYPPNGAQIASTTFAVAWMPIDNAVSYRFQLDDNIDFASPAVNVSVSVASFVSAASIAPGTYYWRVRPSFAGQEGGFTPATQIQVVALPSTTQPNGAHAVNATKTLNIPWQLQRKDTKMLCLDGDDEAGGSAWDIPHTLRNKHDASNCGRATIAMIASYYGAHLSQDRISHEVFNEMFARDQPEGDMGHGVGFFPQMMSQGLNWALGATIPFTVAKPSFAQIKAWIDNNQPIAAGIPGHMRAIDGYWEWTAGPLAFQFLHVLDPWDSPKWVSYASDPINAVWIGPAGANGAPNARSDEDDNRNGIADTMEDSDGDGVTDFDERVRFLTGPAGADSDGDLVPDKLDIRSYIFTADGKYGRVSPDIDRDGDRKELDRDNDRAGNNGALDGCEDLNRNGKPDAGEQSSFDPADDLGIQILLYWPLWGADVDLHFIRPGGAMNSFGDCYYGNRAPDWGTANSTCDDPYLDVDCITQCTIETIRLGSPAPGTYSIKVHYYSDHGKGDVSPDVTVWIKGVRQDFGPSNLSNGQIWDVGTIQWPGGAFTAVNTVRDMTADERAAFATK